LGDTRGRKPLYTPAHFIAEVHRLYDQADKQNWDLTDATRYPAEWIGNQLKPHGLPERTLNEYLRPLGGIDALQCRFISADLLPIRPAKIVSETILKGSADAPR
jgi:hypothetical protein